MTPATQQQPHVAVRTPRRGLALTTTITVVLAILKLTGLIGWSWWWVLAPLWAPWALIGLLVVVAGLVGGKDRR